MIVLLASVTWWIMSIPVSTESQGLRWTPRGWQWQSQWTQHMQFTANTVPVDSSHPAKCGFQNQIYHGPHFYFQEYSEQNKTLRADCDKANESNTCRTVKSLWTVAIQANVASKINYTIVRISILSIQYFNILTKIKHQREQKQHFNRAYLITQYHTIKNTGKINMNFHWHSQTEQQDSTTSDLIN